MTDKVLLWTLIACLLAGCRTPPPPPETRGIPPFSGTILRVNHDDATVIASCTFLPMRGELAKVFRGDQQTGTVIFNGPFRPPLAVGDILNGAPAEGEAILLERLIPLPDGQEQ